MGEQGSRRYPRGEQGTLWQALFQFQLGHWWCGLVLDAGPERRCDGNQWQDCWRIPHWITEWKERQFKGPYNQLRKLTPKSTFIPDKLSKGNLGLYLYVSVRILIFLYSWFSSALLCLKPKTVLRQLNFPFGCSCMAWCNFATTLHLGIKALQERLMATLATCSRHLGCSRAAECGRHESLQKQKKNC